ncbi:MAG: hypothetical protein GXO23_00265 [Crenarchaeota archaeon]|nr:hypothetical protein [Thermoproteota archaeon]
MKVKTIHRITTIGPTPNKSYNPSIFIPRSLWERVENRNNVTVKGLVLLGWRVQKSRDVRLLNRFLSYEDRENIRRLIDIISILGPEEKKKVHLKFLSKESYIALRIYEQHLRLYTTISNYLLYLLIIGLYLNSRVVLNYSTSNIERREALRDEEALRKVVEKAILKKLEKEDTMKIKSTIAKELLELGRRTFAKHIKKIEEIRSRDQLSRYILDNLIFSIRPGQNAKYYVKICLGDVK